MIVWLASYPKSGNTFMRMLLASWFADSGIGVNEMWRQGLAWSEMHPVPWYTATGDGNPPDDVIIKYRPVVQSILATKRIRDKMAPGMGLFSGEDVLLKTHHSVAEINGYTTINPQVSKGAVYIVRDPRDAAISYSHHFGLDLDAAIAHLANRGCEIRHPGRPGFQFIGSWSDNVESWIGTGALVVRYEDLLTDCDTQLNRVLKYLGQPSDRARVRRAVANSRFEKLQAEEARDGFIEEVRGRFFRQGKAGAWQQTLNQEQVLKIEAEHGTMMSMLGYEKASLVH